MANLTNIPTLEEILKRIDALLVQVGPISSFRLTGNISKECKNLLSYIRLGKYDTVPSFGGCECRGTYVKIIEYLKTFKEKHNG